MMMLQENCTLGKCDFILASMKIAVDYEYMDMESKTGMGYSLLWVKVFLHYLHISAITDSVFESGISAPMNMIMYEVTMTFVADYDHMERYFQIGMDDLFYSQLPLKLCIHFLNIRAPAVSVETFESEFSITLPVIESRIFAQMNMIMYEVTMTFVAKFDHMERYFQIGMNEMLYSQIPFKVCLLFLNITVPAVFVETFKSEISSPLHMLMATVYCNVYCNLLVDVLPDWGKFGDVQGPFLVDESLRVVCSRSTALYQT
ncbi:hypothetical protein GIB67_010293 [Kingdonia uniflora]|uniref:Uncharacterized protein n=1 Tax=Kingdonia uniflora TaxID=39325 RepID=A0A7J7LCW4_9MAGN|nr:hypothetical protein GIB67_010293 [Kingdonia uniflora]